MLSSSRSSASANPLGPLRATACILGLWLALAASTLAADESTPAHIAAAVPHARLSGQGPFRYLLFRVYDARFWVGDAGFNSDAPSAAPFALELTYALNLKGADIAKTALDEFERLGAADEALRQKWYEQLRVLMPDVSPGQRLTGIFVPQDGLQLYSNGVPVGALHDPELARWFFAIWLDPRTQDPKLRAALLADAGEKRANAP